MKWVGALGYMYKQNLKPAAVAVLVATSGFASVAFAQDAAPADEATIYGNLHLGAYDDIFANTNPLVHQTGIVGGGKLAIEPIAVPFGFQLDGEGKVFSSVWMQNVNAEGTETDMLAVAHATYAVNDVLKLGLFGGYEDINQNFTNVIDPLFSVRGATNLSRANTDLTLGSIGAEALYAFSDSTWVQARAGYIKPMASSASATNRTTGITQSIVDDNSGYNGYQVGLGARFGVFDNFSMRADANFISLLPPAGNYADTLSTLVTGQYAFDGTPFSAYAQLGYQRHWDATSGADTINSRGGITWSFGAPTHTTRNKLFRSAGFGGVFN
jgi:hypothetical protein